jgi:zinc transport system substrate-binding protein
MKLLSGLLCAAVAALLTTLPAAATPRTLVTIKPIHSLVSAVMAGAGTPDLLVGGAASVHTYALKPSDARKLAQAELVFEVGPDLETWLTAPLKNLSRGKVIVLARVPGVKLLPARRGGLWEADADHDGPIDPHIWLDPRNAIAMTRAIAAALAAADPAHAALYRANAARTQTQLAQLDGELKTLLVPAHGRAYLVFHDAYQYFETRYGLKPAGAVTVAPDRPVGPRRIEELRRRIAAGGVSCTFREPQFPPKLIETLAEGTAVRTAVLDPLGADVAPGPGLYPAIMRTMAHALAACLKQ